MIDSLLKKLVIKIRNDAQYLSLKLSEKKQNSSFSLNQSMYSEDIKSMTISFADIAGTQYVMYSEITVLSFADATNNE